MGTERTKGFARAIVFSFGQTGPLSLSSCLLCLALPLPPPPPPQTVLLYTNTDTLLQRLRGERPGGAHDVREVLLRDGAVPVAVELVLF